MKVTGPGVEGFLREVGSDIAAVLLYGPDASLVRERSDRLAATVAGSATDPFCVSEVSLDRLREVPSSLSDEAAALTFGGGPRVVRLREAGDSQTKTIESFLTTASGGLLIVEAGELGPRSSLRLLFEACDSAAAVPCYRDEGERLDRFVTDELRRANLRLSDEARDYLLAALGGDRGVTRREIDKIVTYMGEPGGGAVVQLSDAMACAGDTAAQSIDDLALAVADGDAAAVERLTQRVLQGGTSPVLVVRAAARHFMRLHLVAAAEGDRERVVRSMRPPIFPRSLPRFHGQVRRWAPARLHQAISRLLRAEMDCKRTKAPAEALCRQVLLEIAARAPGRPADLAS